MLHEPCALNVKTLALSLEAASSLQSVVALMVSKPSGNWQALPVYKQMTSSSPSVSTEISTASLLKVKHSDGAEVPLRAGGITKQGEHSDGPPVQKTSNAQSDFFLRSMASCICLLAGKSAAWLEHL